MIYNKRVVEDKSVCVWGDAFFLPPLCVFIGIGVCVCLCFD